MATVYLSLGSNKGDRSQYIARAMEALGAHGVSVRRKSSLYETEPVGGPPGQDRYLNVVVELDSELTPRELLQVAHGLEERAGRVRTVRNGPRTLDVDVLLVGDLVMDEPDLVVPHPRMWERRFVVAPLSDLAPELVSPSVRIASGGDVHLLGMLEGY